jgi:hypothetical protein
LRQADLALPTPRTTENDLAVTCNRCLRSVYADLPALIATGYGDVPLREPRSCAPRAAAAIRSRSCMERDQRNTDCLRVDPERRSLASQSICNNDLADRYV